MWRFTLFGFPVTVHWMFWVVLAIFTGGMNAGIIGLILCVLAGAISILIHELGHTFMQRYFGARPQIVLYGFGGLAIPDRGFTREQSILISLAGPVVQIVLGLIVREVIGRSSGDSFEVKLFLTVFWWVSVFWGLLNLAPIFPLDGGQVLSAFLGPQRQKTVYLVGVISAVAIGIYMLVATRTPINAILFGLLAWDNFQRYQGQTPPSFMRP